MNRQVGGLLVVLLGASVMRLAISGEHTAYVQPSMRIPLLATGILMLLVALPDLLVRRGGGHHHPPRVALALLVPTLLLLAVRPPALGAWTAERAGTIGTSGQTLHFDPLPAGDPVDLTVGAFSNRATLADGPTLTDRRVRLTGFVVHEGDGWQIGRVTISCCAADALPHLVRVESDGLRPEEGSWVEVVGTWKDPGGPWPRTELAVLRTESVRDVPEPAEPYEYAGAAGS